MSIDFSDLYKKIQFDGYDMPDVFNKGQLKIANLDEIVVRTNINGSDRLDQISGEYFDDDRLYWLLMILNREITNPLILTQSFSQQYRSIVKSITYNPVKFTKTYTFESIADYVGRFNNIIKNIESGNITCDKLYTDLQIQAFIDFQFFLQVLNSLLRKNKFTINEEEPDSYQQYRDYTRDVLDENEFKNIVDSINPDLLDINDETKYNITDSTLIYEGFDKLDILDIKTTLDYLYFWSTVEKEV